MNYNKLQIEKLRELPKHGMAKKGNYGSKKSIDFSSATAILASLDNLTKLYGAFDATLTSAYDSLIKVGEQSLSAGKGIAELTSMEMDFAAALQTVVKESTFLEQRNKSLNKTFGIGSKQAAIYGAKLDEVNKELKMGGTYLRAYAANLNSLLPGQAKNIKYESEYGKGLLKTQDLLITRLGLTGDEANNVELLAARRQQSSQDYLKDQAVIAKLLETETGQIGVFRDVTAELTTMASDTRTQFGRMPGNLEVAILKARALGTTVESLAKTGRGMLNIEQSVTAELEYQQLSGKRLIKNGKSLTAEYRKAFLTGDATKMAQTQEEILRTQGDVIDNNVLAREALAKAMNIETSELMRQREQMLLIDEAGRQGIELNVNAKDFEQKLEDAIAKTDSDEKKALLNQIKTASDTRTTDQRIEQILDNIYTKGIVLRAGKFGGQEALISDAMAASDNLIKEQMKQYQDELGADKEFIQTLGQYTNQGQFYQDMKTLVGNIYNALPVNFNAAAAAVKKGLFDALDAVIGSPSKLGQAERVDIMNADNVVVSTEAKSTGDLSIRAGGGPIVAGPEGSIFQGTKNDDVAMGPGVATTARGGGGGTSIDYDRLAAAMTKITLYAQISEKGMNET